MLNLRYVWDLSKTAIVDLQAFNGKIFLVHVS